MRADVRGSAYERAERHAGGIYRQKPAASGDNEDHIAGKGSSVRLCAASERECLRLHAAAVPL